MGVVVRRYIDILIIIITFPYSTSISSFGSSIPISLFVFKCFLFFYIPYGILRYSTKVHSCSVDPQKNRCNYLINRSIKKMFNTCRSSSQCRSFDTL